MVQFYGGRSCVLDEEVKTTKTAVVQKVKEEQSFIARVADLFRGMFKLAFAILLMFWLPVAFLWVFGLSNPFSPAVFAYVIISTIICYSMLKMMGRSASSIEAERVDELGVKKIDRLCINLASSYRQRSLDAKSELADFNRAGRKSKLEKFLKDNGDSIGDGEPIPDFSEDAGEKPRQLAATQKRLAYRKSVQQILDDSLLDTYLQTAAYRKPNAVVAKDHEPVKKVDFSSAGKQLKENEASDSFRATAYWRRRGETVRGPFERTAILKAAQAKKLLTGDQIANSKDGPWQNITKEQLQQMQQGNDVEIK